MSIQKISWKVASPLWNACFPGEISFEENFPQYKSADAEIWGLHINGMLVSVAGFVPQTFKSYGLVHFLGAIATSSDHQKKGYARTLLENVIKHYQSPIFLWGEFRKLYQDLGFEPWGTDYFLHIPALKPTHTTGKLVEGFHEDIVRYGEQHDLVRRSEVNRSIKILASSDQMKIFSWVYDDYVLAYLIEGKGRDLKNVVHEWGYETPDAMRTLLTTLPPSAERVFMGPKNQMNKIPLIEGFAWEKIASSGPQAYVRPGVKSDGQNFPRDLWIPGLDSC